MVLVLLTLACSAADLVQRERATPTPVPTLPVLMATFTPSPTPDQPQTQIIVTPPGPDRPGVIIVPPGTDPQAVLPVLPTSTPTATPTAPTPTATPIALLPEPQPDSPLPVQPDPDAPVPPAPDQLLPVATDTPLPTPTPYIMVTSGLVTLRTGPGLAYPSLAQLGPNLPVAIIGRSDDGGWLELCCVSGQTVWVVASHVAVFNDIVNIQVSFVNPPPEPSPTPTPTETATLTPTPTATPYPFERAIGPQFFPTDNEYVSIWVKLFVGAPPLEQPAAGHYVTVLFEGFERPNATGLVASDDTFQFSAPPGFGNRVTYNLKYEYYPPDPSTLNTDATSLQLIGTGTWTIYVSDGSGAQLSEPVTFTTAPSNPNREIYIGWVRLR
jgi:hypothetical protein